MLRVWKRRLDGRSPAAVLLAGAVLSAGSVPAPSSGAVAHDGVHAGSGCPHPSVPVPPQEPVYRTGPTKLVSGLYIQGGAVPAPPCKPEPRGPYAGKITVTNARTGETVASASVKDGHLARIPLAPGKYQVSGQFSGGGTTSYSPTVKVRRGYKVRQDVFEDVP
jgi:hypothetical protein